MTFCKGKPRFRDLAVLKGLLSKQVRERQYLE